MLKENIKIELDQIMEVRKYCSVVEYKMDRTIEIALGIIRAIEMILGKKILEGIQDQIKIIEDKITEVDIEEFIETIIMKEVGVGLEKESFQIIQEGMTEVVAVGLDQVQELVLIEIGLDAINVESMIILLKTVQLQNRERNRTNIMDV